MAKLVANRYAEALFAIAVEEDSLQQYETQVKVMYDTLSMNKDFLIIINHPQVTIDEKMSIIEKSFKDSVSDNILGLFALVFRKSREENIMDILESFLEKAKIHKGIVTAYVSSATVLDEKQISQLQSNLSKKLNKQVEVQVDIDKSLIGGLKINVDGRIIDSTIKYQMLDMKSNLLKTQFV